MIFRWKNVFNMLIIFSIYSFANAADPITWKTYQNKQYQISIPYPASWIYAPCISGYKNGQNILCIGFQSTSFKETPDRDYDILFELQPLNLEDSIDDDLSFNRSKTKFFKHGRLGDIEVQHISGKTWQGIYANAPCKSSQTYPAGECLTAILSRDNYSAIFKTSTKEGTEIALKYMIPAFEFGQ